MSEASLFGWGILLVDFNERSKRKVCRQSNEKYIYDVQYAQILLELPENNFWSKISKA